MRNAPTATSSTSLRARTSRPPATWRRSRDVVLDDPLLATIVSTPSWTTTTWRRPNSFGTHQRHGWSESNSNQLLPGGTLAYQGAYGVKTGTSGMAGQNLVSAARNPTNPNPAPVLGDEASPDQLPSGSQSRLVQPARSNTSASGESTRDRHAHLGRDRGGARLRRRRSRHHADRFVDSKIVLDFALGRTP